MLWCGGAAGVSLLAYAGGRASCWTCLLNAITPITHEKSTQVHNDGDDG